MYIDDPKKTAASDKSTADFLANLRKSEYSLFIRLLKLKIYELQRIVENAEDQY